MRVVDHAGSGPPFGHCLYSSASRGVNCATIELVEMVDVVKHHGGVAIGLEEVARLMKPSDQPLASNPYSSLPSCSSMPEPPGDPSDSSVSDEDASEAGLLVHLISNRVHGCSDSGSQKTRCGLAFFK